jgi:AcrR family transcriptional regulator
MARTSAASEAGEGFQAELLVQAEQPGLRKGERTALRLRAAICGLLEAAPLSQLKVQEICARAGISQGTFYLYFPDRDHLLNAVLEDFVAFVRRRMLDAARDSADRAASLHATTLAYCQVFAANRGLMKILLNHYEDFPQARAIFQGMNRAWIDTVARSIRRRVADTALSDDEITRRAYALGGMVDQYLANLLLARDDSLAAVSPDLGTVAATLTAIWRHGFGGQGPWD